MPTKLKRKVKIGLNGSVMTLEFHFPDAYSAIVYRDDIVERLESGEGCSIEIGAPKQKANKEQP